MRPTPAGRRRLAALSAAAITLALAPAAAAAPDGRHPGGSHVTRADRALAATSLREDLTRERFYFVMADRFANGDTGNDTGGYGSDPLVSGYDPTHKGFYHGGDLKGILERLDYVEGLGTTAIWLTPSFKNKPVQGEGANTSAGYHGYWITDFTQIDPHLGTNEELEQLVDAAHARGIKVFFDIITNHTADVISYAEGTQRYVPKATEPYRDAAGQAFDDREFAGTGRFPELDAQTSFPYTPVVAPAEQDVKVPGWLNDPTMYHNRGDALFNGGESDQYGDFVGLDDLFTERPEVVEGMEEIYEAWVDFGIDGFRIDTVKHVNTEFWQEFAPAIEEHAAARGNEDFFSFGEVYDSNPEFLSRYTTEAGLQATLDFGFQARARGFSAGGDAGELREFYAQDDYYTDADSNAYSLPTFLGNHDMGRIGAFLRQDGVAEDELLQRDELAHALMYLTRGQPVVYYGDEQGFTGDGGDQDARQDVFASQVSTYNDDDLIGTDATTAQENFDPTHPLYRAIAELAQLREEHPALADGAQIDRYASEGPGVYAFSRIGEGEDREYLVAVNNSDQEQTVTFDTFDERRTFKGLWPAGTGKVRSNASGEVTVTVPALSAAVWRASAPLKRSKAAATPVFTTDGTVGGRAEVGVDVPGDDFNQVTFAYRAAGAREWTPLGTDDNAPYRVFHDVTDLPEGTQLEYRAVVQDHSGNLAAAGTAASVVPPPPAPEEPPAEPGAEPEAVAAAGSFNSEIGCPEDWQPACEQAQLTLDETTGLWTLEADLPEGSYEFKAALNGGWDENYGDGGAPNGGNIPLVVPAGGARVTFTYDHATHLITASAG
ncbi:alpha-amylase family glycosyl hydrolase [Kineococcus auxinigenes]|uniref:alpha-amylase family glycosyl hydrolase n=1 Tax=unclassified Kineococcus TaxID=2621656 RepID=UPI003D7CCA5F